MGGASQRRRPGSPVLAPEGGRRPVSDVRKNGGAKTDLDGEKRETKAMELIAELWAYLKARKKWWLLPIILVMFGVGMLLVFAQGSALAPFIYTIF